MARANSAAAQPFRNVTQLDVGASFVPSSCASDEHQWLLPCRESIHQLELLLADKPGVVDLVRGNVESRAFAYAMQEDEVPLAYPGTDEDVDILVNGKFQLGSSARVAARVFPGARVQENLYAVSHEAEFEEFKKRLQLMRARCVAYSFYLTEELELQKDFRLVPDVEIHERRREIVMTFLRARQKLIRSYISCAMKVRAWNVQRMLFGKSFGRLDSSSVLWMWLFDNILKPYPKKAEKEQLAQQTGLSEMQIANWFINARMRFWRPLVTFICPERVLVLDKDVRAERVMKRRKEDAGSNIKPTIDEHVGLFLE
ncbi:BEL1-like homeodomain protein 10 [Porphyridium purpureum]|uniref:BEL1-like homeodomain protein 10 n=1 Tax=Porphyridium purpureum TaxID=35688 RepID=A0A5J4Z1K5_PORPP|nr:BEL1-like homeodomain protein 10 [Porphyridium purpureum]|eukprot:POR6680..scf208_2